MSKFISNCDGFIGLTLSQLGLFVAVAILLAASFNFIYMNDWGREEEIETIAGSFSNHLDSMDTYFFENKTSFFFPDKNYDYNVFVSTEYIIIEAESGWFSNNKIRVTKRLFSNVLIRNDAGWKTGDELHEYLFNNHGFHGTYEDPIRDIFLFSPTTKLVKDYINIISYYNKKELAENPILIDTNKPVLIEKVYIYYDNNSNGIWESDVDSRDSLLLLYQK